MSDLIIWLKRQKPKPLLCDACAAELRQFQSSGQAEISTRFVGPVLVRQMSSYQVLSLPGFCGLYIVDSIEEEVPRFMEEFRKLADQTEVRVTAHVSGHHGREPALHAIEAAKEDIDPTVRAAARELERVVRSEDGQPENNH